MGLAEKLSEVINGKKLVDGLEALNEQIKLLNSRLSMPSSLPEAVRPPPETFSLHVPVGMGKSVEWAGRSGILVWVTEISCDFSDSRYRFTIADSLGSPAITFNAFAFRFRPVTVDLGVTSPIHPFHVSIEIDPDAPEAEIDPPVGVPKSAVVVLTGHVMSTHADASGDLPGFPGFGQIPYGRDTLNAMVRARLSGRRPAR